MTKQAMPTKIDLKEAAKPVTVMLDEFASYLTLNPKSDLIPLDNGGLGISILAPWGDASIRIDVPSTEIDVAKSLLASAHLPPRLVAVHHRNTREIEFIYTADESVSWDIRNRKFTLQHNGDEHFCQFRKSSDLVMLLARHAAFIGNSETNYRNLPTFKEYQIADTRQKSEPLSFWVSNVSEIDDNAFTAFDMINGLTSYFDAKSPKIIVLPDEEEPRVSPNRYRLEYFPSTIDSNNIDPHFMSFWNDLKSRTDPFHKIIAGHRIIEGASFAYVPKKLQDEIASILKQCGGQYQTASLAVAAQIYESNEAGEEKRQAQLAIDKIGRSNLAEYVFANSDIFEQTTVFVGGFEAKSIIGKRESIAEWIHNDNRIANVMLELRRIRNSLAHGRQKGKPHTIKSCHENRTKIKPWCAIMEIVAGDLLFGPNWDPAWDDLYPPVSGPPSSVRSKK